MPVSKAWKGKAVAIIASGPSLTADDCVLVETSGLTTIAVNSSWRLARFASVIYAGDACWWDAYGGEIDIDAERVTCSRQAASKHGIKHHSMYGEYNSGMRAIQLAIDRGAKRIVLLGFDCSLENGIHWHGPHDKTSNPDVVKVKKWHRQFSRIAAMAKHRRIEVINCSRHTELDCFERVALEDALCSQS